MSGVLTDFVGAATGGSRGPGTLRHSGRSGDDAGKYNPSSSLPSKKKKKKTEASASLHRHVGHSLASPR